MKTKTKNSVDDFTGVVLRNDIVDDLDWDDGMPGNDDDEYEEYTEG